MGGGGSKYWKSSDNDDILKKIQDAENQSQKVSYDSWLADFLISSLGEFNNRDNDEIKKRINTIKTVLGSDIDGVISTQFGGSIAKRTHVDGLSDVDTLVILNDTSLADKSPAEVLDYFHKKLSDKFPGKVDKGDMAVTVNIDGRSIQLLPALKYKSGIKISDAGEWSSIVNPSVFARKLTVMNKELNGKLIPGIKLIKAMVANMPEAARLKGYHIESLAVEIFSKNQQYSVNNIKDVVVGFFKESSNLVKNPIKDTTGQTFYVDEYLGNKQSVNRMIAADALERVSRRIDIAESGCQKDIWDTLVNGG
jgi:hypothetical protein